MNNELERILGDVADDAAQRAGDIPVDALRTRGVRRRRARRAGFGAIGVAATFGLVLGTAQLLPDDGAPAPAAPTTGWPTADPSLPLGACGSVATHLPITDSLLWLELSSNEVVAAVGAESPVAVTLQNYEGDPLDLSRGEGPWLFAVRDGVVVGFSWPTTPGADAVPGNGEYVHDDLGPFVLCEPGEQRPSGDVAQRTPLPEGSYTIHSAITLRPDAERAESEFDWTFDLLGREGTLTVTEPGEALPDLPGPQPDAVAVELPTCGEPIDGFELPEGVRVADFPALEVVVGHTGQDEDGAEEFFGEGYGDQLQVLLDHVNEVEDWGESRELDAAVVIARDGVVVAEMGWPAWHDVRWQGWPRGESRSIGPVGDWVDCTSGEHGQVPKGDYEILGWRTVEVTRPDGSTGTLTIGYPATSFTAYDFEDPENAGPGTCEPLPVTRLVDGSPAGEPQERVNSREMSLVWGEGEAAISQRWGEGAPELGGWEPAADDLSSFPPNQVVEGPSGTHMIMPVGDFGLSMVQVRTMREGCATVIWLPAGTTLAEARAFAADL